MTQPNEATVYTLTGNLLWEKTLTFSEWQPGKTQRAQSASFQVGGKGINVSRMLARFAVSTKALCFAGGGSGRDCVEWLRARNLEFHAFPTRSVTRSGVVVRSSNQPETTFLGPDAIPDAEAFAACARELEEINAAPNPGILALCGSFPGWDTQAAIPLKAALVNWQQRAPLVVDSYGPPLLWAIEQPLELIKINRTEFDGLFSPEEKSRSIEERFGLARERWPAHAWVITDGPSDVWLISGAAKPENFHPPKVDEISATGSGDVLLAAVIHAHFYLNQSWRDAVDYALPYAAANVASEGIAEFDLNNLPARRSLRA